LPPLCDLVQPPPQGRPEVHHGATMGAPVQPTVGPTKDTTPRSGIAGAAIAGADSAYAGKLVDWAKKYLDITIKTVRRPPDAEGFVVLPRRWVVDASLITWAAITLMTRRLTRRKASLPNGATPAPTIWRRPPGSLRLRAVVVRQVPLEYFQYLHLLPRDAVRRFDVLTRPPGGHSHSLTRPAPLHHLQLLSEPGGCR
jgi:transposase